MKNGTQQYLFSLFAQILLPLSPLLLELQLAGSISSETWAIVAAMYIIAIGISSKNLPLLGISILAALFFIANFGFIKAGKVPVYDIVTVSAQISIVIFSIIYAIERYNRHINEGELFIKIGNNDV